MDPDEDAPVSVIGEIAQLLARLGEDPHASVRAMAVQDARGDGSED